MAADDVALFAPEPAPLALQPVKPAEPVGGALGAGIGTGGTAGASTGAGTGAPLPVAGAAGTPASDVEVGVPDEAAGTADRSSADAPPAEAVALGAESPAGAQSSRGALACMACAGPPDAVVHVTVLPVDAGTVAHGGVPVPSSGRASVPAATVRSAAVAETVVTVFFVPVVVVVTVVAVVDPAAVVVVVDVVEAAETDAAWAGSVEAAEELSAAAALLGAPGSVVTLPLSETSPPEAVDVVEASPVEMVMTDWSVAADSSAVLSGGVSVVAGSASVVAATGSSARATTSVEIARHA